MYKVGLWWINTRIKKEIALLKIGNGLENGITQGQIIDEKALFKVKEHIQDAINKGAQLIIGGKPHERGFNFLSLQFLLM